MSEWIIELKWDCRSCGTEGILGREGTCPQCGNPRDESEIKKAGVTIDESEAKSASPVVDPTRVKRANLGADWFCSNCEAGNPRNADQCVSCGSPQGAPVYRLPPPSRPPRSYPPPVEVGKHWREPDPINDQSDLDRQERRRGLQGLSCFATMGGFFFLSLFIGIIDYAFLHTTLYTGKVKDKTWEHRISVEAWQRKTIRAWEYNTRERPEVPPVKGAGERAGIKLIPGSCNQEYFGQGPSYNCGSREESYDCSTTKREACGQDCKSTGNGFARCTTKYCTKTKRKTCKRTVPIQCSDSVYKDRCTYETQEWQFVTVLKTNGHGDETYWPEPEADDTTRFTKSASYVVVIAYGEADSTELDEKTEAGYRKWPVGSSVTVAVNAFGGVREVQLKGH